jgi:hypothetical protein
VVVKMTVAAAVVAAASAAAAVVVHGDVGMPALTCIVLPLDTHHCIAPLTTVRH